jgi:phospho-N-acetylmuramoyl-pentapeptide-transferase
MVAIIFAWLTTQFPDADGITSVSQAISFVRDTPMSCRQRCFCGSGLVTATTNAVNLTDGLDGLAERQR